MTWTAPTIDRRADPSDVDEREMLEGWLDFQRDTLLLKCAGLTGEQLATRAVPPSTLSLLGLVRHMAEVERSWFRRRLAAEQVDPLYFTDADPDADFNDADGSTAEADFATFVAEVDLARAVAARGSLDDTFLTSRGRQLNLRWIYVHMIEEYARHNGHADLFRECIDGVTGV